MKSQKSKGKNGRKDENEEETSEDQKESFECRSQLFPNKWDMKATKVRCETRTKRLGDKRYYTRSIGRTEAKLSDLETGPEAKVLEKSGQVHH